MRLPVAISGVTQHRSKRVFHMMEMGLPSIAKGGGHRPHHKFPRCGETTRPKQQQLQPHQQHQQQPPPPPPPPQQQHSSNVFFHTSAPTTGTRQSLSLPRMSSALWMRCAAASAAGSICSAAAAAPPSPPSAFVTTALEAVAPELAEPSLAVFEKTF